LIDDGYLLLVVRFDDDTDDDAVEVDCGAVVIANAVEVMLVDFTRG